MGEFYHKDVIELFDGRLHDKSRYLYPGGSESVESRIVQRFRTMRQAGNSITLVDGAFDVPHNNHEWYLRHCKLLGAFASLKAASGHDIGLDDLLAHVDQRPDFLTSVKLAVTVDADEKVAMKKSGLSHKGGIERPVYPWSARADRLAGYHFSYGGMLYQTIDLVTVEGDSLHDKTPLESSLALAAFLRSEKLLDTFIIYGEHSRTVDDAEDMGLDPLVIPESPYETNPQTGTSWSSSRLIRRAQGEAVALPITRPEGL